QQFLIQSGEYAHRSMVDDCDVARSVRTAIGEGDGTVARERESSAASRAYCRGQMLSDFLEVSICGVKANLAVALVVVLKKDAGAVGSPLVVGDVAVEFVGHGMRSGAITIHKIQLPRLVALIAVVESFVGDQLSIRGNGGRIVRPFPVGESANGAIRDVKL